MNKPDFRKQVKLSKDAFNKLEDLKYKLRCRSYSATIKQIDKQITTAQLILEEEVKILESRKKIISLINELNKK